MKEKVNSERLWRRQTHEAESVHVYLYTMSPVNACVQLFSTLMLLGFVTDVYRLSFFCMCVDDYIAVPLIFSTNVV